MKIGRNDPCPCKSGKKHKKCCLHVVMQMKNEQVYELDVVSKEFTYMPAVTDASNDLLMQLNKKVDPLEVKKQADHLDELYPNRPEVKFAQAACLIQQGNKADALPLLQEAVELFPFFFEAYYYLGQLYLEAERFLEGVSCFEHIVKHGESGEHFTLLAQEELSELNKQITKTTGISLQAYIKNMHLLEQASDYLKEEKFEHAVLLLQDILQKDPNNAQACFALAFAYTKQDKEQLAVQYFCKAYTLDPELAMAMTGQNQSEDEGDGTHNAIDPSLIDQSQQFLNGM